jgi:hypothetical protein
LLYTFITLALDAGKWSSSRSGRFTLKERRTHIHWIGIYPDSYRDPEFNYLASNVCVVRFEVFTAVTMKNAVFWDVTPCRSCVNRRFGGKYRLHLQGRKNSRERNRREQVAAATLKIEAIRCTETSVHTGSTPRHFLEDGVLQGLCCLFFRNGLLVHCGMDTMTAILRV